MGHDHAALEDAGADPGEGEPVPVGGVHARLDLEDERAERCIDRSRHSRNRGTRPRGRSELKENVEQLTYAVVEHRRAEEHRRGLAGEETLLVVVGAGGGEQLALLYRRGPGLALLVARLLR